MKLVNLMPMLI